MKDGNNTSLGPIFYTFMIPVSQSYNNSSQIIIPFEGPATPYPSEIEVSGLNNGPTNLLVSKVTATLNGFAHSFPHDVEAVLVNPAGQEVVLMEHAGGAFAVSNLVLTFDDAATQRLASNNVLTNGTYLTTEYSPFDVFPGLAPVPTNSPKLATFNGMNPNGIWSLYVYDDTPGKYGVIASGWSLNLTGVSTVNTAARLVVSTIEAPNPVIGGDYVYYEIIVSNAGPAVATSVYLTNTISAGASLAASPVTVSQGTYTINGNVVTCAIWERSATARSAVGHGQSHCRRPAGPSPIPPLPPPPARTCIRRNHVSVTTVQVIGTEASIGAVAAGDWRNAAN